MEYTCLNLSLETIGCTERKEVVVGETAGGVRIKVYAMTHE